MKDDDREIGEVGTIQGEAHDGGRQAQSGSGSGFRYSQGGFNPAAGSTGGYFPGRTAGAVGDRCFTGGGRYRGRSDLYGGILAQLISDARYRLGRAEAEVTECRSQLERLEALAERIEQMSQEEQTFSSLDSESE